MHRVDAVVDSGVELLLRATARVNDATADRTRSPATESVEDEHVRARVGGLDCRARACRAEPHDHHVRDESVHAAHPRTGTRSRLW